MNGSGNEGLTVGGVAYLDGRDPEASPPLTIKKLNLWDGVPRVRVRFSLSHGTRVKIIERKFYKPAGRAYYRVRRLYRAGWISENFLSPSKPGVVGDLL